MGNVLHRVRPPHRIGNPEVERAEVNTLAGAAVHAARNDSDETVLPSSITFQPNLGRSTGKIEPVDNLASVAS
jgi:hypothetical protein